MEAGAFVLLLLLSQAGCSCSNLLAFGRAFLLVNPYSKHFGVDPEFQDSPVQSDGRFSGASLHPAQTKGSATFCQRTVVLRFGQPSTKGSLPPTHWIFENSWVLRLEFMQSQGQLGKEADVAHLRVMGLAWTP